MSSPVKCIRKQVSVSRVPLVMPGNVVTKIIRVRQCWPEVFDRQDSCFKEGCSLLSCVQSCHRAGPSGRIPVKFWWGVSRERAVYWLRCRERLLGMCRIPELPFVMIIYWFKDTWQYLVCVYFWLFKNIALRNPDKTQHSLRSSRIWVSKGRKGSCCNCSSAALESQF